MTLPEWPRHWPRPEPAPEASVGDQPQDPAVYRVSLALLISGLLGVILLIFSGTPLWVTQSLVAGNTLVALLAFIIGIRRRMHGSAKLLPLVLMISQVIPYSFGVSVRQFSNEMQMTVDGIDLIKARRLAGPELINRLSDELEIPIPTESTDIHWITSGLQEVSKYLTLRVPRTAIPDLATRLGASAGTPPSETVPKNIRQWWKPAGSDLLVARPDASVLWTLSPSTGLICYRRLPLSANAPTSDATSPVRPPSSTTSPMPKQR